MPDSQFFYNFFYLSTCNLADTWSRPIFGLNSDYKALNRDEREERDWARLSQVAKRRLSKLVITVEMYQYL